MSEQTYRSKFYAKMIHNSRAAVYSHPDFSKMVYYHCTKIGAITTTKGKDAIKALGKCIIDSIKNSTYVRETVHRAIVMKNALVKGSIVGGTVAISVKLGLEAYDRAKKNILCYDYENRLYHYILGYTMGVPKANLEPTLRKHARVWKYNNDKRVYEQISIRNNMIDEIREKQLCTTGDEFYDLLNEIAKLEGEIIQLRKHIMSDNDFNEMCKSVFPYLLVESDYDTVMRTAPYSIPRKLYEAVVKNNQVVFMQKQVDQLVNLGWVVGYLGLMTGFAIWVLRDAWKDLKMIKAGTKWYLKQTPFGLEPMYWK
jgi:hypothetical protein